LWIFPILSLVGLRLIATFIDKDAILLTQPLNPCGIEAMARTTKMHLKKHVACGCSPSMPIDFQIVHCSFGFRWMGMQQRYLTWNRSGASVNSSTEGFFDEFGLMKEVEDLYTTWTCWLQQTADEKKRTSRG
jgi:hypothetical protein